MNTKVKVSLYAKCLEPLFLYINRRLYCPLIVEGVIPLDGCANRNFTI